MSAAGSLDFRNTNSLWGSVLVETLARLGVTQAVISPGSRSTPLTIAFARHESIESIPVLDERSAAFFALGIARRTRRPVVLLCTSGTAGANYFPAIIEAQESGVPLLVITADRPPEMRECRSGQTIDQQKLFGAHVNFYHELSVPVPSLPLLRYLRQTVAHAWERTQWPFAGPVHLNAPFRDPLPPVTDDTATPLRGKIDADFFSLLPAPQGANTPNFESRPPSALWSEGWRGLIVVGPVQPADTADYVEAVSHIAQVLRWPVLADALTPLRNHAAIAPLLVTTYDTLLRSPKLAAALKPECVLCLGGWPTSKRLREWLQQLQAPTFLLADDARNHDPLHGRTQFIRASVESFARCLGHAPAGASPWLKVWRTLQQKAEVRLDSALKRQQTLFEGKASWMLPWVLPPGTPVFVANSMPVRDVEYFWPANDGRHEMYFNRGANGIDGTLSTALGIAHGGRPAVLLTGDLALLHDANGFLVGSKLKGSLTVVLVNNNGGGIFEHLPVAKFDPPFEEFFATPQSTNFAKLCAAHGVTHIAVKSWTHFARLLGKLPKQGVRVLELRTDRKRDAAFRQKLFADVAAKLK